jgi:hypothetical protein
MYSLRVREGQRAGAVSDIGFFHDDGALAYARRTAGNGTVEIWRDEQLVAVVDKGRPLHSPVQAPVTSAA